MFPATTVNIARVLLGISVLLALELSEGAMDTAAAEVPRSPKHKAFKICSVAGGLDMTRLVSSKVREVFRSAIEDVELIREYVLDAAFNGGVGDGMDTLEALNNTLDWQARNLTSSDTTISAGLGYTDDRRGRLLERYVSLVNEPLVGTKETDLALVTPVANLFPWLANRRGAASKSNKMQVMASDKMDSMETKLYKSAWIGTYGEAWMYYPSMDQKDGVPYTAGDNVGAYYSSHDEKFIKPNLPENNPSQASMLSAPYEDTTNPGLAMITAMTPISFTGNYRGYEYNDTYVATAGIDISVESMSLVLKTLEGTLSAGSFGFVVTADTFETVAMSQSTVEKLYPARTELEEESVVSNEVDESIISDRRNRTQRVSGAPSIFRRITSLQNADWSGMIGLTRAMRPGYRNNCALNLTLTGDDHATPFVVMVERWKEVADYALVVMVPKQELKSAMNVIPSETELDLHIPKDEPFKHSIVLYNNGTMDVIVGIEKLFPASSLLNATDEGVPYSIPSGGSLTLDFEIYPWEIKGTEKGMLAFKIEDDDYPDCFDEQVLTMSVNLTLIRDVELNQLGDVRTYGFLLAAIITLATIACLVWTACNRENRVVRASQPVFLYMMCSGILMMGFSIIPMSLDDSVVDLGGCDKACMATPWFLATGFSVAFAALFSKIWRINQIMSAKHTCRSVRVSVGQVLIPFITVITINTVLLSVWTIVDPLVWTREEIEDTFLDASVGSCKFGTSSTGRICCLLLFMLNLVALALALFQMYKARSVATEYSEGKYIAIAVGSMVQIFLTGLPVMLIIPDNPEALYLVKSTIVFVVTMSLLLLTFVPKFVAFAYQRKPGSTTSVDTPSTHPTSRSNPNVAPARQHDKVLLDQEQGSVDSFTTGNNSSSEDSYTRELSKQQKQPSKTWWLPAISDISLSLATIKEDEDDIIDYRNQDGGGRSALSAQDGAVDCTNARYPVRRDSSVESANARFPVRRETEVEA